MNVHGCGYDLSSLWRVVCRHGRTRCSQRHGIFVPNATDAGLLSRRRTACSAGMLMMGCFRARGCPHVCAAARRLGSLPRRAKVETMRCSRCSLHSFLPGGAARAAGSLARPFDRRRREVLGGILVGALALLWVDAAPAQVDYPTRAITIVVPLSPGGTADILARVVAEQLREAFAVSVVVENRPGGAGGLVGTESFFRAPPDGYPLLCAPQLTFSIANALHRKLTFDVSMIEPVSVLATYPAVLLVRPDLPVDSTAALIAFAKDRPGTLNYGSQGVGQIG